MDAVNPQNVIGPMADLARRAGELLREGFAGARAYELKSTETDLVTEFDHRAEELIIGDLRRVFPDHRVHAEESGESDHDHRYTWYIDPLDGTNNFAHGLPHFCTCIGLCEGGEPIAGAVYDPIKDEMFTATHGGGAFITGADGATHRLKVSETSELMQCMMATGFAYDKHTAVDNNVAEFGLMIRRVRGIRRLGSAGLDLAYVAAGRFDGFWEIKLNPWDVAAGVLLITEAGGRVSDLDGRPLDITRKPVNLIASNGHVHERMGQVLDEARP